MRREVKRLADLHGALPQEVTGTLLDIATELPDLPFFPNPRHAGHVVGVEPRVERQAQVAVQAGQVRGAHVRAGERDLR